MKKTILIGLILLVSNLVISQSISTPKLWFLQACVGNSPDFDHYIEFDINGAYDVGSEFVVLLSDENGDFANYSELTRVAYVSGENNYNSLIFFDYNTIEAKNYKIKVTSTSPIVESPESVSFQIISVPEVSIVALGPTEFCVGGEVQLETDVKGNIKWYKDGELIPGEKKKRITVTETGEYSMQYDTGACTSESNIISVVATQVPTSSILENTTQTICYPDTFTFNANSSNIESETYQWLDQNDNIVSTGKTFTSGTSGKYRLQTLNYGVCSDVSQEVELIVNRVDAEILESSLIMTCISAPISLSSKENNPSYNYIWYKDGIEYAQGLGLSQLNFNAKLSDNGIFTLKVEGLGCATTSQDIEIKVVEEPVFNIVEGNQKKCFGANISLSSSLKDDMYSYQWYYNSNPFSNEKELNFVLDASTEGEYILEISYGSTCVNQEVVQVDMVSTPNSIIDLIGDVEFCEGDSLIVNSISTNLENESFVWLNENDVEISNSPQLIVKKSGQYRLMLINDAVCSSVSQTLIATMNKMPFSSILEGREVKSCSSITLHSNSKNLDNPSYKWIDNNGDVLGTGSSLDLDASAIVYLETTNNGLCSSISEPIEFIREALNAEISGANDYTLCSAESVLLKSANIDPTYTYQWYFNSVIIEGETSEELNILMDSQKAGVYTLKVSNSICSAYSSEVSISYIEAPISQITNGSTISSCDGTALVLQSLETGSEYTYKWYHNGVLLAGENSPALEVLIDPISIGDYELEISFSDCYKITSEKTIISISEFNVDVVGEDNYLLCNDESVELEASVLDNSIKYNWYKNGILIDGETSNTLQVDQSGEYQLLAENGDACISQSKIVQVRTFDDLVGLNETQFKIKRGDVIELLAFGGVNYEWYVNDILVDEGGESFRYVPNLKDEISLKIIGSSNCFKMVAVSVQFEEAEMEFLQNLITPNGDGKNDYWVLPERITSIPNTQVTIVNRQGSVVYSSMDYNNDWGGSDNGKELPAATYYYVIRIEGGQVLTGSVSILR